MGPNVKKLVVRKFLLLCVSDDVGFDAAITVLAIPGTAEIGVLSNPERIKQLIRESQEWVEKAIAAVKAAPDSPYDDDESIAGELLKRIESRRTVVSV